MVDLPIGPRLEQSLPPLQVVNGDRIQLDGRIEAFLSRGPGLEYLSFNDDSAQLSCKRLCLLDYVRDKVEEAPKLTLLLLPEWVG